MRASPERRRADAHWRMDIDVDTELAPLSLAAARALFRARGLLTTAWSRPSADDQQVPTGRFAGRPRAGRPGTARPARRACARRSAPGPRPGRTAARRTGRRSEEHTSELQSRQYLVCRLLLEKTNPRFQARLCLPNV